MDLVQASTCERNGKVGMPVPGIDLIIGFKAPDVDLIFNVSCMDMSGVPFGEVLLCFDSNGAIPTNKFDD
jgi:hypothetical protein